MSNILSGILPSSTGGESKNYQSGGKRRKSMKKATTKRARKSSRKTKKRCLWNMLTGGKC